MRKNKAKKYIAQALIWMLLTDKLEDIKVKDICARAGVSRMTYYRYYNDKNEILEYYMETIFDDFLTEEMQHPELKFHTVEHIEFCLNFFREHGHYAHCLYDAGMEGVMLKAVNQYLSKKTFAMYAYGGAIYNCYMQWVLEDFKTDVHTIAQIIWHLGS